ncbi:MAG: hypothetical protein U0694_07335 [Anaerolineae bacterium]
MKARCLRGNCSCRSCILRHADYQPPDTAYVLLLPETGETVILPPLPQDELQGLESRARETGRLLRDAQGRELGHLPR